MTIGYKFEITLGQPTSA